MKILYNLNCVSENRVWDTGFPGLAMLYISTLLYYIGVSVLLSALLLDNTPLYVGTVLCLFMHWWTGTLFLLYGYWHHDNT